jgi:hypothetical protein
LTAHSLLRLEADAEEQVMADADKPNILVIWGDEAAMTAHR